MIKINLIPPEHLARQKQRQQLLYATVVGMFVVVLCIFVTIGHIHSAVKAEKILKEKQQKLVELQDAVNKVKEMESVRDSVKSHLDALTGLLDSRMHYPYFMQDIVKTLSPSVWFTSVTTTWQEGSITFRITATARNGDDVAGWLASLEKNTKFKDASVGAITVNETPDATMFLFPVSGIYLTGVK